MAIRRPLASRKVERALHEMHQGDLHSGSKMGPRVTNVKQAVAIGLNEARNMGAHVPPLRRRLAKS